MIDPGRGLSGWSGAQPLGPMLDRFLNDFANAFKISKDALYASLKHLIFANRLHAVACAIYVCNRPKPEYSTGQSLEELFTMWSNQYWTGTLGPDDKQEYYKNLETAIREEVNFNIHEIAHGFLSLSNPQVVAIPEALRTQYLEFIYIVRTDAVNKLVDALNKKSAIQTSDQVLRELISAWNPEGEATTTR